MISFVFPFKAALQALDAAVNGASPSLGRLARAPARADAPRSARSRASGLRRGVGRLTSNLKAMAFPQTRMRRLRASAGCAGWCARRTCAPSRLVLPLFVAEDEPVARESDRGAARSSRA